MTNEQVGRYIKMICIQHLNGHFSTEQLNELSGGSEEIKKKYIKDDDGMWYNERLQHEIDKKAAWSKSQTEKINKRWEKYRGIYTGNTDVSTGTHTESHTGAIPSVPVPVPNSITEKKSSRSAKPPDPHADEFSELWKIYPKRAGSNPKPKALQAYGARIREGVKPEDIRAGLERYVVFCEATDKIGTETVMQAARFFGPGREWENEFKPPLPKVKLPTDSPSLWAIREQYGLDPFYEDLPTCHREIRACMQQHPEIRPPQ